MQAVIEKKAPNSPISCLWVGNKFSNCRGQKAIQTGGTVSINYENGYKLSSLSETGYNKRWIPADNYFEKFISIWQTIIRSVNMVWLQLIRDSEIVQDLGLRAGIKFHP